MSKSQIYTSSLLKSIIQKIQRRFSSTAQTPEQKDDIASMCYLAASRVYDKGYPMTESNAGIYYLNCFSDVRDFYKTKWERDRTSLLYENSHPDSENPFRKPLEDLQETSGEIDILSSVTVEIACSKLTEKQRAYVFHKIIGSSKEEIMKDLDLTFSNYETLKKHVDGILRRELCLT